MTVRALPETLTAPDVGPANRRSADYRSANYRSVNSRSAHPRPVDRETPDLESPARERRGSPLLAARDGRQGTLSRSADLAEPRRRGFPDPASVGPDSAGRVSTGPVTVGPVAPSPSPTTPVPSPAHPTLRAIRVRRSPR